MKFELGDLYRDDLEKINEQKRLKREERKALQLLNGGPRKRYPPTHYAHVTQSGRKLMVKEYGSKKQIWNKIGRNDLGTKEYIDFEWNWSEDSDEFGRMDAYWLSENDKATYLPIEFDGRWTLKGRT